MRVRCTFFFAFGTWINVSCEEPPGIGVQPTGGGEINVWVHAEGYHPSGVPKVITEAPPLRTSRHHMKTHAVFIRENITALVRSCGAHYSSGE